MVHHAYLSFFTEKQDTCLHICETINITHDIQMEFVRMTIHPQVPYYLIL